jgi:tetratricopeptide (TPR) repeat protein
VLPDIERAIALEPRLAEAQGVLVPYHAQRGEWLQAAAAAEAGTAMDPGEPLPGYSYAYYVLLSTGRLSEAHAAARRAHELAPAWGNASVALATMDELAGREDEALRLLAEALELGYPADAQPTVALRFRFAFADRDWAELAAVAAARFPAELLRAGADSVAATAVDALAGKRPAAAAIDAIEQWVAARGERLTSDHYGVGGTLGEWLVRLGAVDRAFAMAERLLDDWRRTGALDSGSLPWMWRPEAGPLRADPRFHDLVERLGMLPYWGKHGPPDGYAIEGGRLVPAERRG